MPGCNVPVWRIFGLLLAGLLAALAASAHGEDWPRWRGVRGDGTWAGPKVPGRWPEGGPKRLWRKDIGGGYAGISVAGERVVTMDRQTAPREVERIVCLAAESGETIWTHEYPVVYGDLDYGNGPRAAPTIDGRRVYTLGALGHVCCLELATGKPVWSVDTVGGHKAKVPMWGLAASPVIEGGRVIVHVGAPGGCLLALDGETGRLAWRGGDDPAGYATPIVVEHAGNRQIVCWTPENVVGVSPEDGRVLWKVPYKVTYGVSIATPIFADGLALVAGYWEGAKAIRLGEKPTDATIAWEDARQLRGLMSQPLYHAGHVYLLDKGNGLTCFELASGKKKWDDGHRLTPRGRNPQASLVWLDAGKTRGEARRAIALNSEGELILATLSLKEYKEESRAKIIGTTWAHPAYAGTRCFARSDSEIVAVSLVE